MNAAPPRILGHIAGTVGRLQQRAYAFALRIQLHHANAHPHAKALVLPDKAVAGQALLHLLGQTQGLGQRLLGQHHAEFVAAQAAQVVLRTQHLQKQLGHLAQQRVARAVATGVVHHLELVQVQVTQHVGLGLLAGAGKTLGQRGFKGAAVAQPGQLVVRGLKRHFAAQTALLGHIPKDQHRPLHHSFRIADGGHRRLDQHAAPRMGQAQLRVTLGLPRCHGAGHHIQVGRQLATVQRKYGLVGPPDGRHQRGPRQGFGHRVDIEQQTLGVGGDDGIADGMQGDLQALFLLVQRIFGTFLALQKAHPVQRYRHVARQRLHEIELPVLRRAHALDIAKGAHAHHPQPLSGQQQGHIHDGAVVQLRHHRLVGTRVGAGVIHHHHVVCRQNFLQHAVPCNRDVHGLGHLVAIPVVGVRGQLADDGHKAGPLPQQGQPGMGIAQHLVHHGSHRAQNVWQSPGTLQTLAQLQQGFGGVLRIRGALGVRHER